jgi:hypothetical protein
VSNTVKGIYWNTNGLKDQKNPRFISDLTKEHNLNFIALSKPEGATSHRDY